MAAALVAGVCSSSSALAQSEGAGAPTIIKHRINRIESTAPTVGSTGPITPLITYHGGPLVSTPVIYLVWYGNWNQSNGSDTAAGKQIVLDFAQAIGGSPYFAINTTYDAGSLSISGNVTYGGAANDSYSRGSRLRDSDILTIINRAINNGGLPYDANGVYFVLTSSDVTETSGFCTKYCGWHTAGTATAGHVRYAFVGNANRCLNACAPQTVGPNGNAGVDGMISVIAHELEEATTDPDPRSGWADSGGGENADKCAWTFGTSTRLSSGAYYNVTLGSRNYLIQRNLVQASDGNDYCRMTIAQ
jgi:hypothetical protein